MQIGSSFSSHSVRFSFGFIKLKVCGFRAHYIYTAYIFDSEKAEKLLYIIEVQSSPLAFVGLCIAWMVFFLSFILYDLFLYIHTVLSVTFYLGKELILLLEMMLALCLLLCRTEIQ